MENIIQIIQIALGVVGALILLAGASFLKFADYSDVENEGDRQSAHLLRKEALEARGLDLTGDAVANEVQEKASNAGEELLLWGGGILLLAVIVSPGSFVDNLLGWLF